MRILLACNAGMSTSMIVSKMEEIVQKNGENHIIWAVDIESIDDDIGEFDVLLSGPQVRYKFKKLKEKFAKKNIPVEVIDSTAYGLCDAESILEQAKNMKKGE